MGEKLNDEKLGAVTGGYGEAPTDRPCKYRCLKCGYEFEMKVTVMPSKIHCPLQYCDGAVAIVSDN